MVVIMCVLYMCCIDITRKNKLLQKQKEGKKRMKQVGNINIGQDVFNTVMKIR